MYCYRFNSRNQFRTLAAADGLVVDNDLITASHTFAIDEIGIITEGGEFNPQSGETITAPTIVPGWHVNACGIAPEKWDEFLVAVNSCVRCWFGGATYTPADEVLEEA